MDKLKSNIRYNKETIIKPSICFCVCFILLLSLFFSNFFERLINNTSFFYSNEVKSSNCKLHFIDVGQGDCSFIEVDGKSILIDCGPSDCFENVKIYLNNIGINKGDNIDYLILTHTDSDHVGACCDVLNEYNFKNIYLPKVYSNFDIENGFDVNDFNYSNSKLWYDITKSVYNEVGEDNIFYNQKGNSISSSNFNLHFYAPILDKYENDNDYSPIMLLSCGNFKAMFVGDIGNNVEQSFLDDNQILNNLGCFNCDVLKVAHHGSKNSTSQIFLDALNPSIAVISCSLDNSYNHPSNETINRLISNDCKVYRTDTMGSVFVYTSNNLVNVKTNFLFVGKIYFKWIYFVLSGIVIVISLTVSLCFINKSNKIEK